jgi:hypothetical protein
MSRWITDTGIPTIREWGQSFLTGLQPHIDSMWERLQRFYQEIQPQLQEAWAALQRLWDMVVVIFNERLKPAFDRLAEALGISTEGGSNFAEVLGRIIGTLLAADLDIILWLIVAAVNALTTAIGIVSWTIDSVSFTISLFTAGLSDIRDAFEWVIDIVWEFIDAVENITDDMLPDWLTPGSPTPFELGLRGIGNAIKDLPDLGSVFGGLSGGNTVNMGGIHFAGGAGAPRTASQAGDSAFLLMNALAARGVAL